MKAYRSHWASHVHFDPDCAAWSNTNTNKHPLVEIDLRMAKGVKFCQMCSPEELKHPPVTHHALCDICGWKRPMPCEHNGGLAVVNIDTVHRRGEEPHRRVNVRWRWPENVLGAPLADPQPMV